MNTRSFVTALACLGAFLTGPVHALGHQDASAWEASYNAEVAGKLEAALSALSELPSQQRNGYRADYRRGWLLYRLGRYAESVTAYRSAVSKEPAAVEARLALLLPLTALTKWSELAQVCEAVLKVDPENYLALQRLALAKFSGQRFAEAEALYRRILVLYPSDIEMRAGLGWTVLRMGRQAQAAALFSEVLDVAGSHPSATQGLRVARGQKAER
jgi:tetratricopeptide (TPR) repeat protein